jgi:TDG/mug DNA glycosylase family protein
VEDILGPDLRVLFVGFNPSLRSGVTGRHYAGRGNQFWALLAAAGLTPRRLNPAEDRAMLDFGLGSTNLVSRPTATAAELSRRELREGVPRLRMIVAQARPLAVAYTGKGVYLAATAAAAAPWGLQAAPLFPTAADFVLPSPSGLARLRFEEKLVWYRALREMVGSLGRNDGGV